MASEYGVNVKTSSSAARPLAIKSSTPIAVVGTVISATADLFGSEPLYYGSATEAKETFEDHDGTIREALDGIEDQNVQCPIIIKVVMVASADAEANPSAEAYYGQEASYKSKIITAINELKVAAGEVGIKPNLIVAPRFSHDLDVATEMTSVAERLLAMSIVDLNTANESAALVKKASFGTRRVLLRDPYVKVWDTYQDKEVMQPDSGRVAGMIAATDARWEYGFADSFSNRVMNGISGTARPIEFNAGQDCEADRLRSASVGTIIRYNGFRTWGGETTDIDPIFQDHTRLRVFDRVSEAALDGLFWAIDRRATDVLKAVKDSVEQMLLALKGAGVLVGFEVEWDEEQNTKANITAGKFYLIAYMQNSPIVKRLEINFNYADRWGEVLMRLVA